MRWWQRWVASFVVVVGLFFLSSPMAKAGDVYAVILSNIQQYNADPAEAAWIAQAICYASSLYGVDPLLLTSVMEAESQFRFSAVSRAGAVGLMQLMPDTASAIGVNPYEPLGNVIGGASYLRTMLDDFAHCGDYAVTNAIAAYNAGPQAVFSYGGCPPYGETRNYVVAVADNYQALRHAYDHS